MEIQLTCSANPRERIEVIIDKFGTHFAIIDEQGDCHEIQLDKKQTKEFITFINASAEREEGV